MSKRKKILPKLTVKYILDRVNQEDIFSAYFGIPTSTIEAIVGTNKKISAPYRDDSDPSFGFTYRANGKLIARDFGGYFWGDCFDCVAFVLGYSQYVKFDFGRIMEDIAKTFGIHSHQHGDKNIKYKKLDIQIKHKPVLRIQIRKRKWMHVDGLYWYRKYGVTREILEKYNVFPVSYAYFNGNCIYEFDYDDPAYAYFLGFKDNIEYWKIYYPFRKKGNKFHSNGGIVQGIKQIQPAEFGIITKSLKDVMCLSSLNVQAIAPPSETTVLTVEQVRYIQSKWNCTLSLMDFDETGRNMARTLRRKYNIPSLFITNGDFNTFDFGKKVKDISDYHAKYGHDQTLKLKENIIANDFEFTDNFATFITQLNHY